MKAFVAGGIVAVSVLENPSTAKVIIATTLLIASIFGALRGVNHFRSVRASESPKLRR